MNNPNIVSQIGCPLKYVHMNAIVKQRAIDLGVTHVLTHKGDCFNLPSRILKELKMAGYVVKYICYATNDRNHWGLIPIVQFWIANK